MSDHDSLASLPTPPARRESHVLLEAGQLVQKLQAELAAQDDREQALAAREQALHHAQLTLNEARREQERSHEAHCARFTLRELAVRDAEVRNLNRERELLDADARLALERSDLQRAQAELRDSVLAEFAAERESLDRLHTERTAQHAAWSNEHLAAQRKLDEQLQQERQVLWESMTAEWQQRRSQFDAERAAWESQRNADQHRIDQDRTFYETALADLDAVLAERRSCAEESLAAERAAVEEELRAARHAWNSAQAAALAEQQRERATLDQRLRFQQMHLEKVRLELEQDQLGFRRERQMERHRLSEAEQQAQRRLSQLSLYRDALEEQAKSIDRERMTLHRARQAWNDASAMERQTLDAERTSWEDDHQRLRLELEQQQRVLAQHAEKLDAKRARLDKLRRELEETHRANLELRLAVEETWVQIAQAVGSDQEARIRVEKARQALSLYYQELHAGLVAERTDLFELQLRIESERAEFVAERQTLAQWLNDRDETLRAHESQLRMQIERAASNDAHWETAREQWLAEKLDAEAVIRRLLSELGERHRDDIETSWSTSATVWSTYAPEMTLHTPPSEAMPQSPEEEGGSAVAA